MKMEQSVLKHWHIKFRHWGITQKKAYNISSVCPPLFLILLLSFLSCKNLVCMEASLLLTIDCMNFVMNTAISSEFFIFGRICLLLENT